MIANALVRARVQQQVKDRATEVLNNLNLTISDAIRIMLEKVVIDGALPFDVHGQSTHVTKSANNASEDEFFIEEVRTRNQPEKVRILFIGESPPTKPHFFYGGKAGYSPMTGRMQKVFEEVFQITFASPNDFLADFSGRGCFLDDVSHTPVDNLLPKERRRVLDRNINGLAERIQRLKPTYIISVLKRIEPIVIKAIERAEIPDLIRFSVPFPGQGQQPNFHKELVNILLKEVTWDKQAD